MNGARTLATLVSRILHAHQAAENVWVAASCSHQRKSDTLDLGVRLVEGRDRTFEPERHQSFDTPLVVGGNVGDHT